MNNKVDETINAICIWIQKELEKKDKGVESVSEMVKALAELVSARAGYNSISFISENEIEKLRGITIDLPIHDIQQEVEAYK